MSINVFNLPDLGEGLTEADILRWLVAEGDEVWILANNYPVARGEIEIRDDRIAITVTRPADVYDFMAGAA